MDIIAVKRLLQQAVAPEQIFEHEAMRKHTSFKTGGPAAFLVLPKSPEEIQQLITLLSGVPYLVVGNGSNLLVRDGGYDGVLIKLCANYSAARVHENCITAQSGISLSKLARLAQQHGLSGLEFAAGIPGTLGGAVAMNAGAYGGEMKDVVTSSRCVDRSGHVIDIEDHDFGYRHSVVSGAGLTVLETALALAPGDPAAIAAKMEDLGARRREKQPLEYPSAGSTFKRPEGFFAGKLIEDAGLKGYRFGGAMVSEKHAGFVVNCGSATSSDILHVIDHVQQKVYEQFGVELEPEVKIIGEG